MADTTSASSSVEGGHRLTLIDVADLLQAKYAFVSGGKSRMSYPILTFPECPQASTVTDDQHRNAVLYLAGIPEHEEANLGFVIIIDRRQDKWSSLRQLLLRLMEQYFPVPIQKIYVLQPTSFLQRAFADTSLKFLREDVKFKVLVLSSVEDLLCHVDRSQVTSDLDGTLEYDHAEWMEHRTALEKFSANVVRIADMLGIFCKRLQETDFPNDVGQTESLIADHELGKREISDDLDLTMKHGHVLRECFAGKTFGTPSYSDSINGNNNTETAPSHVDDDGDLSPSRRTHVVAMERLLSDLEGTSTEFDRFWKRHKRRLDQCLQLRKFEEQFKSLQFSCERHVKKVTSMTTVGDSLVKADALLAEFQQFETMSKDDISCAENLFKTGRQFTEAEQYAVDCIEPKCMELERIVSEYRRLMDDRRHRLQTSRELYWKLDKANKLCTQGFDLLSNEGIESQLSANDVDQFLTEISDLGLDKCRDHYLQIADDDTMHLFDEVRCRLSDVSQLCSKRRGNIKELQVNNETAKRRHPSVDSLTANGGGGMLMAKLLQTTTSTTSASSDDDKISVKSNETKKWRAPFSVKNHLKRSNSKSTVFNRTGRHGDSSETTAAESTSGRLGHRRQLSNNGLDGPSEQPEIIGYSGSLDDLGELLLEGSFNVSFDNRKDHKLMRELRLKPTSRHVFLYRKLILFCKPKENGVVGAPELVEKTSYVFKTALQVKSIGVTENVKNDKKKFELWLPDKSEIYILQASSMEVKVAWLTEIKKLLQDQFDELRELSRTSSMGALNKLCVLDSRPVVCDSNGVMSARTRKLHDSPNKNTMSCSMVNLHLRDSTAPQTDEMVAKGNYVAMEDNELTVHDGELLQLVEAGTDNWSRVRSLATNQVGWVPARYLVPTPSHSAMKLFNGHTKPSTIHTAVGKNQSSEELVTVGC